MDLFLISLLTLIASIVGTVSGFGTWTIMIPVLVLFLPPAEAIFLVAIIHWFGNVWKVSLFRKGFDLKLVALFGVVGLVTSYAGAALSLRAESLVMLRALGVFLILYPLFLFLQPRFKIPATQSVAFFGGAASGFCAGLFGIGGAIRGLFLSAFDLPKAVYIATAGAIGLLVDSTRIITYVAGGSLLSPRLWWGLLIFLPVSFVGARIAKRVVSRIPQQHFRMAIAVFLLLIGLKLVIWG